MLMKNPPPKAALERPRPPRRRLRGIFIAGTDTGIGKTYVACLVAAALSGRCRVGVFKPFLSGSLSDARKLIAASGTRCNIRDVNPYYFKAALAPLPASSSEKRKIVLSRALRAFKKVAAESDYVVAESAGGLLVPVTAKTCMMDFIKKTRLPVALVARATLGTINHTLLSVEALRRAKIKIAAIIINGYTGRALAEKTNPAIIRKFSGLPVFIVARGARKPPVEMIKCLTRAI